MTDQTTKPKTNGKRNKAAGHKYELDVIKSLIPILPNAVSSRSANRMRDGQKIDICHADEILHGRVPYNIQCKSVTGGVQYLKLHKEIPLVPGVMNVVMHRYTVKKGTQFHQVGEFAIMHAADFHTLTRYRKAFDLMQESIKNLPTELQAQIELLGL